MDIDGLTDRQAQVYTTYHDLEQSVDKTARKLGLNPTSVKKSLYQCARKGKPITPDKFIPQAPAGFGLTKSTIQSNADGDIVQRWDRVSPDGEYIQNVINHLADRIPPRIDDFTPPRDCNDDLMLEWILVDLHLSMHAWGKETGANYDTKIAQKLAISAAQRIFSEIQGPNTAVIVLPGDTLHADNLGGYTEKSKNILDVDTRFPKTVEVIIETVATIVDIAAQKMPTVHVKITPGNHDPHSSIWLAHALAAYYRQVKNVHIDITPAPHKYFRWGNSYFMYTHGLAPGDRLATYLLNHLIDDDAVGIKRKYVRKGHIHKQDRKAPAGLMEHQGVIVETFSSVAAQEAYVVESAYCNMRATTGIVHHKKYGIRSRIELGVDELMEGVVK